MKPHWIAWMLLAATPAFSQILPPGLGNRWWKTPQMIEKLGLSADQQKKMDDVFQQNRVKLIDLTASLDKEEAFLEPLISADQPDPTKIRAQINRVADARSELEKANANMLLGLRLLLTPEQWRTLQAGAMQPRPRKLEPSNPAPKPKTLVPKEVVPGSYLQVMVLDPADAQNVARSLDERGFPTALGPTGGSKVRVLVGPFPDERSMQKARADLESAGFHPVKRDSH